MIHEAWLRLMQKGLSRTYGSILLEDSDDALATIEQLSKLVNGSLETAGTLETETSLIALALSILFPDQSIDLSQSQGSLRGSLPVACGAGLNALLDDLLVLERQNKCPESLQWSIQGGVLGIKIKMAGVMHWKKIR